MWAGMEETGERVNWRSAAELLDRGGLDIQDVLLFDLLLFRGATTDGVLEVAKKLTDAEGMTHLEVLWMCALGFISWSAVDMTTNDPDLRGDVEYAIRTIDFGDHLRRAVGEAGIMSRIAGLQS